MRVPDGIGDPSERQGVRLTVLLIQGEKNAWPPSRLEQRLRHTIDYVAENASAAESERMRNSLTVRTPHTVVADTHGLDSFTRVDVSQESNEAATITLTL